MKSAARTETVARTSDTDACASTCARKDGPMRGSLRTLQVLRTLCELRGATVVELSRATGISRPALYRILETLREAGYVTVDLSRQRYCLTMLIRALANGFTDEDQVTQVSRPLLQALQRRVLWPVDLAAFENDAMHIRETTRSASALTIDRADVGMRIDVLSCAAGRAHLAFTLPTQRDAILARLCPDGVGEALREQLAGIRERGYAHRFGEPPLESGAIAVPVLVGERVVACVVMTFIASVMGPQEAASHFLCALQETARAISMALNSPSAAMPGDGAERSQPERCWFVAGARPAVGSPIDSVWSTGYR